MKAVNLIPRQQRGGLAAGRSNGAALLVPLLIAGLAVLALLYGTAHHQIVNGQAQVATLTAQAQAIEAQAAKLAPYTAFVALRQQRVEDVSTLVDARFDWAHALHELGRVLPAGTSLSSVDGSITPAVTVSATPTTTTSSAAVASATPAGSVPSFVISGCATSQSKVAETLNRLRLIDGVDEVHLESSVKSAAGASSSSSSSSSSSGGCAGSDPIFTVQVSFDALPSSPTPAGAKPTAAASASGPSAAADSSSTSTTPATPTTTAAR